MPHDQVVLPPLPPTFTFIYRRRIALSCAGLALFAAIVLFSETSAGVMNAVTNGAGVLLVGLGIAVRLWSAGYVGGCKKRRIVTDGPYRFIRNPLYAGSFLVAAGMCLLGGSWTASLVALALFVALFHATVAVEEHTLETWFGEEYLSYVRRVPRYVPAFVAPPPCHGTYELAHPGRELLHAVTLLCGLLAVTELMEHLHETLGLPALFP
ncbi:MAG: isoprenylcysteine carboxylmethyltransferase family protein [Acidobacteria bacterium]|nr:isoprenylcysteine carboxylmethyltransferase family protein [Acidobacteriota bacterium]